MNSKVFSILLLVLLCSIYLTQGIKLELLRDEYGNLGTKLNFYEEEYQNGLSTKLEMGTDGPCKNLPKRWHKRAKAVDTYGTCGMICTEVDCQGTCVPVFPNNGEQMLSTIKMDRKVVSARGCFPRRAN